MNAADDKAESTDNSVVKMPKRKSKNRKQNQQQSQGLSSAATKKNLPSEKTTAVGGAAAIAMNGDGSGSLELISQELDNSLHIKENGCMANHIIRNNEQHQSNNIDRTENTPNKNENALHAEIIIENHHHQQQQQQHQSSVKQGSESQGSKKSNFLENGDVSPSLKKLKQSTSVAPSTSSSSTKFKVNGNNNNIKIEKVERTCMAVVSSSESIMQTTPLVEGTQKSSITQKKINDRKESENSNNSNCQGHDDDDDTNVVVTTRTTQNGALSSSNNCERLSNNSRRTVDEVTSLPKDIDAVESAQTSTAPVAVNGIDPSNIVIEYKEYESELQMQDIMRLIQTELSEPYSIYTYRYFIYNWPKLCFLAAHGNEYVGAIVCKLDMHMNVKRGYIAMLAVKKEYRKLKIGTTLVQKAIEAMLADDADEVVLETEMKNIPALRLYENLGFVRDKRLFRYYLNGVDALRLKLWFR